MPASAEAQRAPELRWSAPGGCPGAGWVQARAARHLGRALARAGDTRLSFEVTVASRPDGGFEAELAIDSDAGHRVRTLRDRDCVLLADAVAFILARAIDPAVQAQSAALTQEERDAARAGGAGGAGDDASLAPGAGATGTSPAAGAEASGSVASAAGDGSAGAGTPEDATDAAPPDLARTITIEDPEPPPEPDAPMRIGWALGASGALGWQPLPSLAPGVLAHAALQLGELARIELAAGYYARQSRTLARDPDAVARFDALQASLSACGVAHTGGSELALCLGASAGLVRGDASGLSAGRDRDLPSSALSLGPVVMQPLFGGWALRVALLAQLAFVRPRFVLDSGEAVHAARGFGFLGSLGAELRLD